MSFVYSEFEYLLLNTKKNCVYLACGRYVNLIYCAHFLSSCPLLFEFASLDMFSGPSFYCLNVISEDDALTETHDETLMKLPPRCWNLQTGFFFSCASCLLRKIIVDIIHTFTYNGLASEEYNTLECFMWMLV